MISPEEWREERERQQKEEEEKEQLEEQVAPELTAEELAAFNRQQESEIVAGTRPGPASLSESFGPPRPDMTDAPPQGAEVPAPRVPEVQPEPQPQETTSEYSSPADAAENAQKVEREEGFITQLGGALDYALTDGNISSDLLNAGASLLNQVSGGRLQGLDDAIKGSQELKADETQLITEAGERIAAGEGNVGDRAVLISEGITEGAEGGVALPFTIAARLLNQASPWADPPETIKNSPLAETAFEITQILVPTLLTGGVSGLAGGGSLLGRAGVALAGESALETATQDSAEDLIAGRTLAGKLGEVADYMGMDGTQLTQDLIEGNKPQAQAINAVAGFLQNLGINIGADQLFKQVGKRLGKGKKVVSETGDVQLELPISKSDEKVADILNKDPQDVAKSLDDTNQPQYSQDLEPHQSVDIDSVVPTAKPTPGNEVINEDALIKQLFDPSKEIDYNAGLLGTGDRLFATNLKVIRSDGIEKAINEGVRVLKKAKRVSGDLRNARLRADTWIRDNIGLLDGNLDNLDALKRSFMNELTQSLPRNFTDAVEQLGKKGSKELTPEQFAKQVADDPGQELLDDRLVNTDGYMVWTQFGDEIGARLGAVANLINRLDSGGPNPQDFTDAVERFIEMDEVAQQFLVPVRRAKRLWNIDGLGQQDDIIQKMLKEGSDDPNAPLPLSITSPAKDWMSLERSATNSGSTLRELWEKAKQPDMDGNPLYPEALATFKDYVRNVSASNGYELAVVEKMDETLEALWKKGTNDGVQAIWYASMLTNDNTMKAAGASGILQLLIEPLVGAGGAAVRKAGAVLTRNAQAQAQATEQLAYNVGRMGGLLDNIGFSLRQARESFDANRAINGNSKFDAVIGDLKSQRELLERSFEANLAKLTEAGADSNGFDVMNLHIQHIIRKLSLSNGVNLATRTLTAMDDGVKASMGMQIARGRANVSMLANPTIADLTGIPTFKDADVAFRYHMNDIFLDGTKGGRITDASVIDASNVVTMQQQIYKGADAVGFDRGFALLEEGTKKIGIAKYVMPFVRIGYNSLELFGKMTYLNLPGAIDTVPRLKKVMDGEMGEVARLQLQSQMDQGKLFMTGAVGLTLAGGMTGNNSGNMPRTSFIIPNPASETGYTAVPYGRLEPYASVLAMMADMTTAVRDSAMTQGEYTQAGTQMLVAILAASTDKSFLQGFNKLTAVLDSQNFKNPKTMTRVLTDLASGIQPGSSVLRMFGAVVQPYETFNEEEGDSVGNFGRRWSSVRMGVGSLGTDAIKYDPYTGKPVPNTFTIGDSGDNYWLAAGQALIGMLNPFPGDTTISRDPNDPVFSVLDTIGYKKERSFFSSINGVPLSIQQQSQLSKALHDEGHLYKNLKSYLGNKVYKDRRKKFDEYRAIAEGRSPEVGNINKQIARELMEEQAAIISADLSRIYAQAKTDAQKVLFVGLEGEELRRKILLAQQLEGGAGPAVRVAPAGRTDPNASPPVNMDIPNPLQNILNF